VPGAQLGGEAHPMRGRWVDTETAEPRRRQRKPRGRGQKVPLGACAILTVVIPELASPGPCPKKCGLQGLNSYLCVCYRGGGGRSGHGAAETHKKQHRTFHLLFDFFVTRPLGRPCQLGAGAQQQGRVMGQR
jgi:hypothetical protein